MARPAIRRVLPALALASTAACGGAPPAPGGLAAEVMVRPCPSEAELAAEELRRPAGPGPDGRVDLLFRLQVDAAGKVTEVRMLRGSGDAVVDSAMTRELRVQAFSPGEERRFPIPGCALQTIPLFLPGR